MYNTAQNTNYYQNPGQGQPVPGQQIQYQQNGYQQPIQNQQVYQNVQQYQQPVQNQQYQQMQYGQPVMNQQQTYQQSGYQQPIQNQQDNEQKSKSGYSYPKQMWGAKNKTQGCFIDDNMSAPLPEELESENKGGKAQPLTLHGKFSKLKFQILNYEQNISATYNISPKELSKLEKDTSALHVINVMRQYKPDSSTTGPAYTQIIAGGHPNIKGKTPAQAIIEDQANIQLLQKQAQWLWQNLQKYPKNQQQIDAINNAFQLFNEGKLQQASLPIILFDKQKVPNAKKLDKRGLTQYVTCTITCNFNMDYPISIRIMNAMVKPLNQTTPDTTTIEDKIDYSYQMSLEEWDDAIDTLCDSKRKFESLTWAEQRALAQESARINASK